MGPPSIDAHVVVEQQKSVNCIGLASSAWFEELVICISAITVTSISHSFTYKMAVKITLVEQNYVTVTLCIYAALHVKKEDGLDRVRARVCV